MTIVAISLLALTVGMLAILQHHPLIFDESVYALRVRDFLGGEVSGFYWLDVRASGLPLFLTPIGYLFGATDGVLRSATLLISTSSIVLAWLLSRRLFSPQVGLVAAFLVACSGVWSATSWQIMPDIPGATISLLCLTVFAMSFRGNYVSWWLLVVAPLAAAATAVRYGAPLLIGPGLVTLTLLNWSEARRHFPKIFTAAATTLSAVGLVLLVPAVTGASQAPILSFMTRQERKDTSATERIGDFIDAMWTATTPVIAMLFVLGVTLVLVGVVRRRLSGGSVLICGVVVLSFYGSLLAGVAEYHPRYLAPGIPFLAILASAGLSLLVSWHRLPALAGGALAAALVVGSAVTTSLDTAATHGERLTGLRAAAQQLREEHESCVVLSANPQQVAWYSGCAGEKLPGTAGGPVKARGYMKRRLTDIAKELMEYEPKTPVLVMMRPPDPRMPEGGARKVLLDGAQEDVIVSDVQGSSNYVRLHHLGSVSEVVARWGP